MVKVGDYITTYGNGIFRVEKIIDRYAQESKDGLIMGEKIDSIIVSKQAFDGMLKFCVGYDRSNEEDCKEVSKEQLAFVKDYFENHRRQYEELQKYEIPDIKKNKNIILTLSEEELDGVKAMIFRMKHKFSLNELKNQFIKNKFDKCIGNKGGTTYMLQIVNFNYETNSKKEELYLFDKIKRIGR